MLLIEIINRKTTRKVITAPDAVLRIIQIMMNWWRIVIELHISLRLLTLSSASWRFYYWETFILSDYGANPVTLHVSCLVVIIMQMNSVSFGRSSLQSPPSFVVHITTSGANWNAVGKGNWKSSICCDRLGAKMCSQPFPFCFQSRVTVHGRYIETGSWKKEKKTF